MTESTLPRVNLDLPGAKSKVEVDGTLGLVAKVLVDGVRQRGRKGGWTVPTKGGGESRLELKGFLPGFQRFVWQGKTVFELGAHVPLPERIVMFVPALLIGLIWWPSVPVAILLFLMNVSVVKNPAIPRVLRFVLPVINTLAAGVAIIAVGSLLASGAGA